jgi:UDP-glucose 4-epimerase
MTTVAVTGANGFIARHVLNELVGRGIQTRPLIRQCAPRGVATAVEDAREVDYDDSQSVMRAIGGADVVIHLLGQAHNPRASADVYHRVNVDCTSRIMEACAKVGVRRLVYVSSVKAIGNGGPVTYTDDTEPRPADAYGRSKLRAETTVREGAAVARSDYVILRPPVVYGAGMKGSLRHLIRNVQRGYPIPIPYPTPGPRSLVSARSLAAAIADTAEWPSTIECTYLVADKPDVTLPELVKAIAKVSGRGARIVPIPAPLLRSVATVVGHGHAADRLLGSLRVDSGPFRTTFGWKQPSSLEDGLREAISAPPN